MERIQSAEEAVLFRGFFVFTVPPIGKISPQLAFEYPEDASNDMGPELMAQLPLFTFPYDDKSGVSIKRQQFTFAFTDDKGFFIFGYCYQGVPATPASDAELMCLVSQRPYDQLFDRILEIAGEIWHQSRKMAEATISDLLGQLKAHYSEDLVPAAKTLTFAPAGGKKSHTIACLEMRTQLGYEHPIIANPCVATLFRKLSPSNVVALLASALFERRIIIVSDDLGTATGVLRGVERLCYPVGWEGVFIPIMPAHLLDYCTAPMPYMAGVHTSLWPFIERMGLDEVVVVKVDDDQIFTPFDDHEVFPPELSKKLKSELKQVKDKRGGVADQQVIGHVGMAMDRLMGGHREHIKRKPDGQLEIDWESFSASKPDSFQRAMGLLRGSQSYISYLDNQLEKLSSSGKAQSGSARKASVSSPIAVVNTLDATSTMTAAQAKKATKHFRKPISSATKETVKKFIAARPELKTQKARVHLGIFLGSARIEDADNSEIATKRTVQLVLDPNSTLDCKPNPALLMVFPEVLYVIEESSGNVLQEMSTTSVIHYKTIVSTRASAPVPMLVMLTHSAAGLVRYGHVLATQTVKHCREAGESIGTVCPYVHMALELPALDTELDDHHDAEHLFTNVRRVYPVHYVDRFRVEKPEDVNSDWVVKNMKGKDFASSETVLIASPTSIELIDPFSMHQLHRNATSSFVRAERYEWPAGTEGGGLSASNMRMSVDQRLKIMTDVKEGKITPSEAAERMQSEEKCLKDLCVCYIWTDETMGASECVVMVCTEGSEKADLICSDLSQMKHFADKMARDPFVPTSKQTKPPSAALAAHELKRDDFTAARLLRSGGFGQVFLANQVVHDEAHVKASTAALHKGWAKLRKRILKHGGPEEFPVAVKVLRNLRSDQRRQFLQQAALEVGLSHDSVVKVIGICVLQQPFLKATEFIQYGDLRSLLTTCKARALRLVLREQSFIVRQIAEALAYLHSQRVVHSNVSAESVRVHDSCVVKLGGFQKARKYDEKGGNFFTNDATNRAVRKGLAGSVMLAHHYTPPECIPADFFTARGVPVPETLTVQLSESTDAFMFGVTIWEIITYGSIPYSDQQLRVVELLKKLAKGDLTLAMPVDANEILVKLVESLTAGNPKCRPPFKMTALMIEKIGQSLSIKDPIRDIGHLVSPTSRHQLATVASELVQARRKTRAALQQVSKSGEEFATAPEGAMEKEHFLLSDWRLGEDGQLERKPVEGAEGAEGEKGVAEESRDRARSVVIRGGDRPDGDASPAPSASDRADQTSAESPLRAAPPEAAYNPFASPSPDPDPFAGACSSASPDPFLPAPRSPDPFADAGGSPPAAAVLPGAIGETTTTASADAVSNPFADGLNPFLVSANPNPFAAPALRSDSTPPKTASSFNPFSD